MTTMVEQSLETIPTMHDDDLCHIEGEDGSHALCGAPQDQDGEWCCWEGFPSCGRPHCPECNYIWETEWE